MVSQMAVDWILPPVFSCSYKPQLMLEWKMATGCHWKCTGSTYYFKLFAILKVGVMEIFHICLMCGQGLTIFSVAGRSDPSLSLYTYPSTQYFSLGKFSEVQRLPPCHVFSLTHSCSGRWTPNSSVIILFHHRV